MLKRLLLSSFALLFVQSLIFSQVPQDKMPPLIDREVFFGDPEITGGQLSPDGKYISFIKPFKGTRNIWVKKADEPFENAQPLTADTTRPIPGYFWSWDSKYILYVQDKGGNENYHIFKVNPSDSPKKGEEVPPSHTLTSGENVRAMIYDVPKKHPSIIYIGLNDRDPAWHDLYQLNINSGEKKLIHENNERITGWSFDLEDNLRLATKSPDDGTTEILKYENGKFEKIYDCGIFETCYPLRFSKDKEKFYMVTNKSEKLNFTMLVLFNLASNSYDVVEQDPEMKVDFGGALFSEVNDELVGTYYTNDKTKFYWKDKTYKEAMAFLAKEFLGKEVRISSQTLDEKMWLVTVFSDTDPGSTYLYDLRNNKVTFQYRPRPDMPVEYLSEMKPLRYRSSDGMEIQAYLTLPKGKAPKNLPLVVFPHGGPWARDYWGYSGYAQFLANRGYAVLQSNFRGSTGFGKKYLNAGNKEWGQKMQDDLTYGVKALAMEGTIDPSRVAIFGGSYGGYAALAGLTFTPEVYACGVSFVGPSNLITLLNSVPAYWESIRKMFYERMGDPSNPEGEALLKKQSPLFSAKKIKVPLMVVQGANDPRVKKTESDQIVVACRELGLPVEYIVAPDEGHGFTKPVNNMAFVAAFEKFLATHIGGRYQEDIKPDVKEKLAAITVDINTVELPKEMEANALFQPPPVPVYEPLQGSFKYKISMSLGGQSMEMDLMTTVTKDGNEWIVLEEMSSMMGNIIDEVRLEEKTLLPISRKMYQGPLSMNFTYSSDKLTGKIVAGEKEENVEKDLMGPLFADGAGTGHILATLPLEVGYETSYRNYNAQKQSLSVLSMKVAGIETVEVPAGTFEAYKLEIKPADGGPGEQNVWVGTGKERKVIKTRAVLPELNGAEVVGVLLP